MKHTVLIASKDFFFLQEATEIQQDNALNIELIKATNHFDVIQQLQRERPFDYLLMTLALPHIANGYTLLSRIAGKVFPSESIFVFVQEVTPQIRRSLGINNIHQVFQTTELKNILQQIGTGKETTAQTVFQDSTADLETIRNALNQTMGPAGSFIFESCGGADPIDPSVLIENIVKEIKTEREIEQFYTLLKKP